MNTSITIKGNNEYDIVKEYLMFVRHKLSLSNTEVDIYASIICVVNKLLKKGLNKEQIKTELSRKGALNELISDVSINDYKSLYVQLNSLRKQRAIFRNEDGIIKKSMIKLLDDNNFPIPYEIIGPIINFKGNSNLQINLVYEVQREAK